MRKLTILLIIIVLLLIFVTVVVGVLLITTSNPDKPYNSNSVSTGAISQVEVERVYNYPADEGVIKNDCGCGK